MAPGMIERTEVQDGVAIASSINIGESPRLDECLI
jgi:hypothetical protein